MSEEYWMHPTKEGIYIRADGYDQLYESRRPQTELFGIPVIAWPDHAKVAAPLPYDTEKVMTGRGVVLSRKEAISAGFEIDEPGQKSGPSAASSWRSSIYALSEARERPAATAELLTSRTHINFTVDQARAFLRGLPGETEHTEETNMTTDTDPRAARLAEIANTMSAVNRNNGYKSAKAAGPSLNDIEPAKLKRLAEMRHSALHANGRGYTQEAKTIRLALDTHNRVGTPISQVFAQLDFDVSTLLPKS